MSLAPPVNLPQPEPPFPAAATASERAALRRTLSIRVVAVSTMLIAVLVPLRAKTAAFWLIPTLLDWSHQLPLALAIAAYDVTFVLAFTAVALGLLRWPALLRGGRPQRIFRCHVAMAVFTMAAGVINIPVVGWLGQPFTYQWLMYSDFLRSSEALLAIAAAVVWWQALLGLLLVIGFTFGLLWFSRWIAAIANAWTRLRLTGAIALGLAIVYMVGAHAWLVRIGWDTSGVVATPAWAFVKSCILAARVPGPFTMATSVGSEDFRPPPPLPPGQPASALPVDRPETRNVIFFMLESVAASYVGLYGANHGVTPELDRRRSDAAVFTKTYAHAPATNVTLVALLNGIYPRVSFRLTTSQKPDIKLRGLGEMLRERGYGTAFFASARLDYQRAGEFLAASGDFEWIEDSTNRTLPPGATPPPWEDMAGTDDRATVESAITWIENQGARPFFATVWTNQTHYPYLVAGETRPLAAKGDFNRYLNGLAEIDQAFGRLMGWLETTGRARDTLVVVLGDHGQAFGQHGNYGHAGHIYEENIHIPMVLIQPGLFHGETHPTVGGIVDLVPTIAEILRLPSDDRWQGRSLFSTQRTGRVYFFAAWSDFLMGYRDGDLKKVYNAANDRHIVYDLAADPGEKRNLAGTPAAGPSHAITERVAAWVQHIERTYAPLLAED